MERQQTRLTKWFLLAVFTLFGSALRAETNAFDGTTVIRNTGENENGGNKDPIVLSSIADPNSLPDNSAKNEGRGRREKIEDDAIPKGKAGVGAAMAAGISLTAAGTPMLASPIAAVRARGAALLAKAALEFAQAAATAGTNQQNKKAGDAVNKQSDGPTGEQLPSPDDVKKQAAAAVNSPELQKALGQAGVNSDDFVSRLVSGELSSPEAVLGAANASAEGITADQLSAGAISGVVAGKPERNGKEELPHITFADGEGKPTGSSGSGAGVQLPKLGQQDQPPVDGAQGASSSDILGQAQAMAARAMDLAHKSGTDKILNLNIGDLTEKYLGLLLKKQGGGASILASDVKFYDLGIKRLRPKQNIFHVARKSYYDFGRWRGKRPARMAQVGVPVPR